MLKMVEKEIERGKKDIKENREQLEKSMIKLLDDACCITAVTSQGLLVVGSEPAILSSISTLAKYLSENGLSEEKMLMAIKAGVNRLDELDKDEVNIKEMLESLKEMLEK